MYCRYCGKELPSDSNFCPNCGAKQKEIVLKKYPRLSEFFANHKILSYSYIAWCLIHIGLFLFSSPKGHRYVYGDRRDYDLSDGFYPFDKSLGDVIQGKSYICSLLENVDVYDFSELFFYIILIPVTFYGLYKCYPYLSPLFNKLKAWYNQWKIDNARRIKEYNSNINAYTQPIVKDEAIVTDPDVVSTIEEPMAELVKTIETKDEHAVNPSIPIDQNVESQEQPVAVEEVKRMPLFRRFVGSIIDKVLILFIFVVGSIAVSPYGAAGRLGTYMGLMNSSPNNYEYIDRAAMNRYGTYTDGVSQYYQNRERLANEPPHIGSTMELDMSITFLFIILNLLYYLLFESILSASLGKRVLGGVLLDSADDKIAFGKALLRAICGGVLMTGVYLVFHFLMGQSNYVVIFVFFLLLDLPVFFTKRSLIDICTSTTYAKR